MKRKTYDEYAVLIEGELIIYTLNKGIKRNYYARIKHPSKPKKYIVRSLKTEDQQLAREKALQEYSRVKIADDMGLSVDMKGFNSRFQQYLNWRLRVKNQTSTTYHRIFNRHFSLYFKSNTNIQTITSNTISEYWNWRLDRWANQSPKMLTDAKGHKRPSFIGHQRYIGKKPSFTTMEHETRVLGLFFDWCVDKGYIQRERKPEVYNPITVKQEGSNFALRGFFTPDEMMAVRAKLQGKARTKKHKEPDGRLNRNNKKLIHNYNKLNHWFLFSTATMARPQEIKLMTFGMVRKVKIEYPPTKEQLEHHEWKVIQGKVRKGSKPVGEVRWITEIQLPASISKIKPDRTQKGRIIIPFNGVKCWERIHQDWSTEWAKHYGREPQPDDLLFPNYMRDRVNMPADMGRAFSKFLDVIGMKYDTQGRPRGAYALRKYSISIALAEGSSIIAVSSNSGSTIQTLQKYYIKNDARSYIDELLRDRAEITKRIRFTND